MEITRRLGRGRRVETKDPRLPGAEAVHAVCDEPSQLDFGVILHHVIQVGLVAGDDAPDSALPNDLDLFQGHQLVIIFFKHLSSPLLLCFYYNITIFTCQEVFCG